MYKYFSNITTLTQGHEQTQEGRDKRNANFDIPRYSTVSYGPDYLQVIDSNPRWTILEGTSERKTFKLLSLRARAPVVAYVSLNRLYNEILSPN